MIIHRMHSDWGPEESEWRLMLLYVCSHGPLLSAIPLTYLWVSRRSTMMEFWVAKDRTEKRRWWSWWLYAARVYAAASLDGSSRFWWKNLSNCSFCDVAHCIMYLGHNRFVGYILRCVSNCGEISWAVFESIYDEIN